MLPFYRDRDTPLHLLHPVVKLSSVLSVVVAALVLSHPAYLLAILVGTVVLASSARVLRDWWGFMRFFIMIALTVVLINTLVSSQGSTTFWEGPYVRGFGDLSISLEGVVYGTMMALRLFVVVSAFTILSLTVHPDEFTHLLARVAYRSGLAVSLSTRFYPAVVRDASAIVDAQRSRGLDLDSGGRISRIRRRMPVVMPLFHSSLERAVGTAEAMEARGFGSSGRTHWRRRRWSTADGVAATSAVLVLILTLFLFRFLDGTPSFYPTIDIHTDLSIMAAFVLMTLIVTVPALTGRHASATGGDGHG
jgi:energy-coupling factor transport system permease protein